MSAQSAPSHSAVLVAIHTDIIAYAPIIVNYLFFRFTIRIPLSFPVLRRTPRFLILPWPPPTSSAPFSRCGRHSAAPNVNENPSRKRLQLVEAEFDDDLLIPGQLHPLNEGHQQLPAGKRGIQKLLHQLPGFFLGVDRMRSLFIQAFPPLFPDLETQDGAIRVDRQMCTNLPGVFAAGDCTGKPLQIAKAVGEGLIAAECAADELTEMERK